MDLKIYPGGLTGSHLVENNLRGIELEKAGRTDEAVALYEQNVAACFEGSHPYNRLAIIYRKRKDYDNEIRVLRRAVEMYELRQFSDAVKYQRFVDRLRKAEQLKEKQQ